MITAAKTCAWRLLVAVLACLFVGAALARDQNEPARGMFLIANPELRGTWFSQTVILLIQHDRFGTVGVIINRPTDMTAADLWPETAGLSQLQGNLYLGGPVERDGVTMLVRSEAPPADAEHVFADVYASGSEQLLVDIVRGGESADRVRLYAGYAGWSPGQLDAEVARGSWTVMQASEKIVFADDPAVIWDQLVPSTRPIIVWRASSGAYL